MPMLWPLTGYLWSGPVHGKDTTDDRVGGAGAASSATPAHRLDKCR